MIQRYLKTVLISTFVFFMACGAPVDFDIKGETFERLEKIKNRKKSELLQYLENLRKTGVNIANDETFLEYYFRLSHNNTEKQPSQMRLEHELSLYYINKYSDFYDILFIGANGFVFHSVRKESDYHTNILTGELSETGLARELRNNRSAAFVDYEVYTPSNEPAAFFVVPIVRDGNHFGWVVLQYAINGINSMLGEREGLGRTGEIYLVNSENYMLSESRFINGDIVLKKKINTEAVVEAFKKKKGHGLIADYRGKKVFSCYEILDIFGISWIIIAEIDESEIITEHFKKNADYYKNKIFALSSEINSVDSVVFFNDADAIKVDMNECGLAKPGKIIRTMGVTGCTALAINLKGQFTYLAHISPVDDVYTDMATRLFLRKRSNLVGMVLKRIHNFDIYPSEKEQLRFTIVASHDGSFMKIIEKLMDWGIDLNQIKLISHKKAYRADIYSNTNNGEVSIFWITDPEYPEIEYYGSSNADDIETIVKKIANYNTIS